MPDFNYKKLIKKLKKKSFYFLRQANGSHEIWTNGEVDLVVSNHGSKTISIGTISAIVKRAGFKNIQEFQKF
jgi:predicted RNA binding protein YcfA (HicA-like mRNA interferase family)